MNKCVLGNMELNADVSIIHPDKAPIQGKIIG